MPAASGAMSAPQDHDSTLLRAGGLPAVVIRNKEKILERFCDRAQEALPGARREPHPVLVDTLPAFITRVALALAGSKYLEFASQYTNIPLQHGNERARFTSFSLAELLKEYQFLREILLEILYTDADYDLVQAKIMHRSIDEAMAEAATSFVAVQDSLREMFTAALTHDFRGPLSSALNNLQLMRGELDAGERERFAKRTAQNLRRVSCMISSLLDASRSNAGERLVLDAGDCEVREMLDEIIGDLEPRAQHRVLLDMPAAIQAFWDGEKIRRAIYNLVDNAIKYSHADSTVNVRAVESHGRVQVSVHNYGDPIPPEDQQTLFRPYRRTAAAERSGKAGWGLGLVQVQAVAEAHGGVVNLESASQTGTTFTLDLLRDVRELRQS